MKIKELLDTLDKIAPFSLQENYDNSGTQFADLDVPMVKILLALDVTEEVLGEAIKNGSNVILTHHPIIFSALKQITNKNNPLLFKAIINKINLIAMHTNFDLAENGLNDYVGNLLKIKKIAPIQRSAEKIFKFTVYVPTPYSDRVRQVIFDAGAGKIGNYTETSFNFSGKGTFKPMEGTHPFIGKKGEREEVDEIKIETIVPERHLEAVIRAMKNTHPYEEPSYDVYELLTEPSSGIGLLGEIEGKPELMEFSRWVKDKLKAKYVRLIKSNNRNIKKVALCTGGGSSLLEQVYHQDVDLYITGDITYHSALRAKELELNILDIEHFDTEKFFVEALYDQLIKFKIPPDILIKSKKIKSPYQLL